MTLIIASIAREGSAILVKEWFACNLEVDVSISDFYAEFTAGKYDVCEPLPDISRGTFVKAFVGSSKNHTDMTKVSPSCMISDLTKTLGSFVKFVLAADKEPDGSSDRPSAVSVLMNAARTDAARTCLPPEFSITEKPQKNKLKNDILKWLSTNNLGWSADTVGSLGLCFVDTLADSLWYVDQNHDTLKQRACSIPIPLAQFSNYRQPELRKKRKIDSSFLQQEEVKAHSDKLFNLALSSYFKKDRWKSVYATILAFAESLRKYSEYQLQHAKRVKEDHNRLSISAKETDSYIVLQKSSFIKPTIAATYKPVHDLLMQSEQNIPIFLNDYGPTDRRRRHEYIHEIKVPCQSVLYTHSGSGPTHLHFIWKVSEFSDTEDNLNKASSISKELAKDFSTYHTRAMRREFVQSFGRAMDGKAAFLREAYHRLTGDNSSADTSAQAAVNERIQRILDEEDPDLIWDLRSGNSGRPLQFSVFLEECQKYINSAVETAVDDRRHDNVTAADGGDTITHLATALSVPDLHREVTKRCPEGTAIPSIQWLRFQFWPRRPCARSAQRYTGKLKIKFMIQARQFRSNHVDAHYASALFRYLKEFAIKFKDFSSFVSMDDKHTVKVGEPNCPVAAVERGKQVLVTIGKTMAVSDHDFTRLSLSPSVSLLIDIPESIEESFHRGRVFVVLKENAFQPSSSIRHMTELQGLLKSLGEVKPVLLLYTDGGPDHRLTYLSVQLSLLALFIDMDFDFICAVRTPPQHSWKNPVERIMSILNIGFQGVGCMREEVPHEAELKRCGSLKSIREQAKKTPELEDEVIHSVQPLKDLLGSVICRLRLKEHGFETREAATDDEMTKLWENILKVDESLTQDVRTKQQLKRYRQLSVFLETHCRVRQYTFSILKCKEPDCHVCGPPRSPPEVFEQLHHLPDPVPGDGGRYRTFEDLYGKVSTTEEYLPSKSATPEKGHGCPFNPSAQNAKNSGLTLQCSDCGKWRLIYAARKIKQQQRDQAEAALDTILYSCGCVFDEINNNGDDDPEKDSRLADLYVRANLNCASPIELTWYSSGYGLICIHCGAEENLLTDKAEYYPQCNTCTAKPVPKRGRKFVKK